MKQKERFDEKPKQEHTEPKHHRKAVTKGITVYVRSSLIFVRQLGKIQAG